MEVSVAVGVVLVGIIVITWAWRVVNWLWLRPKKLERYLRQQGLAGNLYRFMSGDMKEISMTTEQAYSKPMSLSHYIAPRVIPFHHRLVNTYRKNSFVWMGTIPRVIITNPEDLKYILTKMEEFPQPEPNPLVKLLATGIALYEGEKWAKHQRIINPVFHLEKLKRMLPAFYESCSEMIVEWESLVLKESSCELDVWPYFQNLTADVISRTTFGSSYKEGRKIFQLLKEQVQLVTKVVQSVYTPGWRFLPTRTNKKMKGIDREIKASLMGIINKREEAIKAGKATKDDLLVHHDKQLWGDDAQDFKPERFSEGVLKATKNKFMYFPFGGGPRICIRQNFAMVEAKVALSLTLQHFTFELSPSYAHAPSSHLTIRPQFGAHIILHKR
ncbi:cytochrome P450 CYP72A219-like [Pyrus ussuriensis x Pyrus communis]|uniref:Cytochrome P450 CYP72A219-like n=1 Tax=Pyrus ussuriensis x Pyrus communis TaxID=2448454 RepID=A0A5N5GYM6_9ROSA|nr:cytochrome P450 CYP72A219-like [Pyrus ussuriensis x Pyrus communis]